MDIFRLNGMKFVRFKRVDNPKITYSAEILGTNSEGIIFEINIVKLNSGAELNSDAEFTICDKVFIPYSNLSYIVEDKNSK